MSEGLSSLDAKIARFEELLDEMREATRESHSVLKAMKVERREIDRILTTDVKAMVLSEAEKVVKKELDKMGPEIRELTNKIYDQVNKEVDRLIDICLGKEYSTKAGREDLRPLLALKLRLVIKDIIKGEGLVWEENR